MFAIIITAKILNIKQTDSVYSIIYVITVKTKSNSEIAEYSFDDLDGHLMCCWVFGKDA